MAPSCISLQGSKTCAAFQNSAVSTTLSGLYPFLSFVSDVSTFDSQLALHVRTAYVRNKYQDLLGCRGISLTNTSDLYARFTTTVLCNAIIQGSISNCPMRDTRPVCAETCAQFAQSEAYIVANGKLCSTPGLNSQSQIRADFTNCALPANSLSTGNCIPGIRNEADNCGYGNSTLGLCSYCASGGINSTDTCCYNSGAESRCAGVKLPSITATISLPTATSHPAAANTPEAVDDASLSRGAVAGIAVGAIIGGLLLLALLVLIFVLIIRRKRHGSQQGSIFNSSAPARKGPPPSPVAKPTSAPAGYEVLPGGRIARMSALEGHSGESSSRYGSRDAAVAAGSGAAAGFGTGSGGDKDDQSSSDGFVSSPGSERGGGMLGPPPSTLRRHGSLSSNSVLIGEDVLSPGIGVISSSQGVASLHSEQLPFFKDYYSQDDIHSGDRVAVLWAYNPRAADEFALERGDMLKVIGIWDDGWATGVIVDEGAEDWERRHNAQRDSGVSTSVRARDPSPPASGEIKAFPLVCVCLPEHWRRTIEGDGSTETGSSGQGGR